MKIICKIFLFILLVFIVGCDDDDQINNMVINNPCSAYYQADSFGVVLKDSSVFLVNKSDSVKFYNGNYDTIRVSYGVDSHVTIEQYSQGFSINLTSDDTLHIKIGDFYTPPIGYYNHHYSFDFYIPVRQNYKISLRLSLLQNYNSPEDTQYVVIRDLDIRPKCHN